MFNPGSGNTDGIRPELLAILKRIQIGTGKHIRIGPPKITIRMLIDLSPPVRNAGGRISRGCCIFHARRRRRTAYVAVEHFPAAAAILTRLCARYARCPAGIRAC